MVDTEVERPPRRRQADRRRATRRDILDAAIAEFDDQGYRHATFSVIAARAGVSVGAVQYHFGTRDQLIVAILSELRDELVAVADPSVLRESSVADRVATLLDSYWAVLSTRHYRTVMQIQLGTRAGSSTYRLVTGVMQDAEAALDRLWIATFDDLDIRRTRLADARRVALAALRGIALRRLHSQREPQWSRQRAMLLHMVRSALEASP